MTCQSEAVQVSSGQLLSILALKRSWHQRSPVLGCSCCFRETMYWELWQNGEAQHGEWGNAVSWWGGAEGEVRETAWCILHVSMWEPAAIFPVLWSPMWSLLINRPGTDLWMTLVCGIIYLENWEQDALCKNIFLVIFNMPNSKSPSFSNIFSILINLYLTFTYNLYSYLICGRYQGISPVG